MYDHYVGSILIEKEMLFCRPLEAIAKAQDVFKVVAAYSDDKDIKWEKLVGICTDRTKAMLGSRNGFMTKMKQNCPSAVGTYYVIH